MLRHLDSGSLDVDTAGERAALLDRLAGGWAARRALSQLIRREQIHDLDEALWLVERLDSPFRRTWCLGDLVASWNLSVEEIERVVSAAPTPAAGRRLRSRSRHPGSSSPRRS